MTSRKHITQPSLSLKMQIANFIVDEFPKQQRWKEYPRGNNMKVSEVWENFPKVNFERVTSSWTSLIDQHDTSLGQRKNRNRQKSNPWPPEILATALTNDLRELAESNVIYLSVLHTQTNPSRTPVNSELMDSIHLWHFFFTELKIRNLYSHITSLFLFTFLEIRYNNYTRLKIPQIK